MTENSSSNVYTMLLAQSPYLSDSVLIAMMNSSVLNTEQKTTILRANSPLTESVLKELRNINLPTIAYNLLMSLQEGVSSRTLLELNIAKQNQELQYLNTLILNSCLTAFLEDSAYNSEAYLTQHLEKQTDNFLMQTMLTSYCLNRNDFKRARAIMQEAMPDDPAEILCRSYFLQEISLKANSAETKCVYNTDSLYSLTQFQHYPACYLIENHNELAGKPRTIEYPVQSNASNGKNKRNTVSSTDNTVTENQAIIVYPNPANQQVNCKFNLQYSETPYKLEVMSITGNILYQDVLKSTETHYLLHTGNWPEGLYIFNLSQNGVLKYQTKLMIRHEN